MGCHLRWIPVLIDAGMTNCIDPQLFKELYIILASTLQIASLEDALLQNLALSSMMKRVLS